jgi:hypothetical protein
MPNRIAVWRFLPKDLRDLTASIAQSVHAIPNNVRLDCSVIYPASGVTVFKKWYLFVSIPNGLTSSPQTYLDFIRSFGFDAQIDDILEKDGKKNVRFFLRDATEEEVKERLS